MKRWECGERLLKVVLCGEHGAGTLGEVGSRVGAVGRAKVVVGAPERSGEVAPTGLRGPPGRLDRAGEGVQGGLLAVEIQSALGTGATM